MAEGLGETFYYPASVSMLSDYHGPATRSRALGLHQTSVYLGTIGGGFLAGLIGEHYGWRASFVLFGSLGVVLGLVLNRFLIEPERGAADAQDLGNPPGDSQVVKLSPGQVLRLVLGTPTLLLLMLGFICANFAAMVLLTWMPTYLYDKFEFSLPMAGLTATACANLPAWLGHPWAAGWPTAGGCMSVAVEFSCRR